MSFWNDSGLAAALDNRGDDTLRPTRLVRTDGAAAITDGTVTSLSGPPGLGKSMMAAVVAAEYLAAGQVVGVLDYEDRPDTWVARLRGLAVADGVIREQFRHATPGRLREWTDTELRDAFTGVDFLVVDAVNDSLGVEGFDPNSNRDVEVWHREVVGRIRRCVSTVLLLDHVAKPQEGRKSRGPIGAQHKVSGIDGVELSMRETKRPFGRGMHGVVKIYVGKDRQGFVKRASADGHYFGDFHLVANYDGTELTAYISPPGAKAEGGGAQHTHLMQKVSDWVEAQLGNPTESELVAARLGPRAYVLEARDALADGGYLAVKRGARNAKRHVFLKPYVETRELHLVAA